MTDDARPDVNADPPGSGAQTGPPRSDAATDVPSPSGSHRKAAGRGLSGSPVTVRVVVALLCALLGVALVVQVRRTSSGDALASALEGHAFGSSN